jgi:hypothetical protein
MGAIYAVFGASFAVIGLFWDKIKEQRFGDTETTLMLGGFVLILLGGGLVLFAKYYANLVQDRTSDTFRESESDSKCPSENILNPLSRL